MMDYITFYNSLFDWLYINIPNFHFTLAPLLLLVDLSLERYIYQIAYYYDLSITSYIHNQHV